MILSFVDDTLATVTCTTPDAEGQVTIDASLFSVYARGAVIEAHAQREKTASFQTPQGRITFESLGRAKPADMTLE